MSVPNRPSRYFDTHRYLFNAFGIWTNKRFIANSLILTVIYSILVLALFIIAPQFCHVVYMYKARNDVVAFADEFYVSLASIMVVFKDYVLIKDGPAIRKMLDKMDAELMRPRESQQRKFDGTMGFWAKLFKCMLGVNYFFCVSQLITPLMNKIQLGTKEVPLVDCYPFYIYSTPVYQFMYIYQSFLLVYLISHTILFDTFVAGIVSFCAGECDILYENLMALKSVRGESNYEKGLLKCIEHHEEIRKFVRNIERRFSFIILELYFTSLISCCTTMFKLSMAEPMSLDFFKTLSYQLNIFLQMYLFCWCAAEVTEKSNRFPSAVYEVLRMDSSKSTKTTVMLFLGKTQKPLTLRTLIFDLSMQLYLQLIRSSFSYYTVLMSLNEQ